MSLLVYAISTDDARAPAAPDLREICAAGLRALAEPVAGSPPASVEQLVRYEETVEKIMRRHTILPMRFGSVLDTEEAVRDLLRERAREFQSALERLCGTSEYGLRISTAHGRSQELREWLDESLDGLVRARTYHEAQDPEGPLSAAFLVDGLAERDFRERLTELSEGTERILWWSGPWPPYSFAARVRD